MAEIILRRESVDIRMANTVTEIIGRGERVDHVVLRDGERIDCDLVVFAIGVRPNTGLVPADSGIRVERGIRVDEHMRTTVPDVYAAGDCVKAYDRLTDDYRQIAIWPLAYRQGYVAGCNMAGFDREYAGGFPMNSISVCDVPTISVGLIDPPDDGERYEIMDDYDRESLIYKKLVLRGHRLVGAMFINDIDRAGIYTGLTRDQVERQDAPDSLLFRGDPRSRNTVAVSCAMSRTPRTSLRAPERKTSVQRQSESRIMLMCDGFASCQDEALTYSAPRTKSTSRYGSL